MMDINLRSYRLGWKKRNGLWLTLLAGVIFWSGKVSANFQVNRYEPTPAGEWSFMVEHPWYSSLRYFAGGITLNYGHNPLVLGERNTTTGEFSKTATVLEHQLIGHVDLAASFLDRFLISASLPVTLLERGNSAFGINPVDTIAVGDPRLGAMVRIWGQPNKGAFSINAGAYLWFPINHLTNSFATNPHLSEGGWRVKPTVVMAGLPTWGVHGLSWSTVVSAYYRPDAKIGNGGPNSVGDKVGTEVELGVNVGYVNKKYRLQAGVEALGSVTVTNVAAFQKESSRLNVLGTFHYNIAKQVNVGVAGGFGLGMQPGNPDGRVLLRIAYAPMKDSGWRNDRDHDSVFDEDDLCIDVPQGKYPDVSRKGCPNDRDGDGILDENDICIDVSRWPNPDLKPERLGCPLPEKVRTDRDGDGVYDDEDMCPDEHMGNHPDPDKKGCPLRDRDGDGVYDHEDMCLDVPQGNNPDPKRKGCPDGDQDKDTILDSVDACPDVAGVPDPNPRRNGCPKKLAVVTQGKIKIWDPLFFDFDKDQVACKDKEKRARNFATLKAVAEAMKGNPNILLVGIHAYADDRGTPDYNENLTRRRAENVLKELVKYGVLKARLRAQGHGEVDGTNTSEEARSQNRRVDFIVEQERKVE